MTADQQLKPCPFCGGPARFIDRSEESGSHSDGYDIGCSTSGCFMLYGADYYWSKPELMARWNRRTP